jgi:ADP-ribosyl-[dinitrogen reductase] hydrolase
VIQAAAPLTLKERFAGLLVGTAVGDSLGLPAEGLSRSRISRLWHGDLHQRFVFGRGMVSDDTEHAFFVGQALLSHPRSTRPFAASLAWKFRLWLLGVPAGIGLATLKATLRLWFGYSADRSGVKSGGNGAAMRAPVLGLAFAHDEEMLRSFVVASSRITHNDPCALAGACAVALAARQAALNMGTPSEFVSQLELLTEDTTWRTAVENLAVSLAANESVAEFAGRLGLAEGVSGYVCHSVPVALFSWLRHRRDFRTAVAQCIACGGDTDTTAAIAGALAGADVGVQGIPADWRTRIVEWPRSVPVIEQLAVRLAEASVSGVPQPAVRYFWPGLALRNAVFLGAVMGHGFRRLLPPY